MNLINSIASKMTVISFHNKFKKEEDRYTTNKKKLAINSRRKIKC